MSLPRILVLGGTGHFGSRICRRLAQQPGIELVVSGRRLRPAETLARELQAGHPDRSVAGIALDQQAERFADDLAALAPFAVIHTAGPYQGQDYRVAEACIAAGAHYLDLADGREFVAGITRLDNAARNAGVLLVSGASTLPGLSSAVIAEYRIAFAQIESVELSIAPAHRTPRGLATVASVLGYCGKPIRVWKAGSWRTIYGWQNLRRIHYAALGLRLGGACDVPDLGLLPTWLPGVRTVSFHAALEARWEQLALWLMAWMARLRLVGDWSRHAARFVSLGEHLRAFGSTRGGMHVGLSGCTAGDEILNCDWYLIAEDNHGPEIACTPAIVLVKKLLLNELKRRGATPCLALFRVDEFMRELANFSVSAELIVGEGS